MNKPGDLIATLPNTAYEMLPDGADLVIGLSDRAIYRFAPGLGSLVTVAPPVSGTSFYAPIALAPDAIYQTGPNGSITRFPRSSAAPEEIVNGEGFISSLRFHGGALFWTAGNPPAVRVIELGAGTLPRTIIARPMDVELIGVDADAVYCAEFTGAAFRILRGTRDGLQLTVLVDRDVLRPMLLSEMSVWFGFGAALQRIPKAGGEVQLVARFSLPLRALRDAAREVYAVTCESIYSDLAPTQTHCEIYRVDGAGGWSLLLATAGEVREFAVTGDSVYWTEGNRLFKAR